MSRHALDLLRTIGLLDNHDRVVDLDRFSDSDLQKLVTYYADCRRRSIDSEFAQLKATNGLSSLVSSISGRTAVLPLLPSALVFERVLVNDTLFKLHREDNHFAKAHRQSLGFSAESGQEHWQVANALAFFEHLAPLMRSEMVICLPLADLHKPPKESTISFSDDWYRSAVPDAVHDFVHENAIIHEVQPGPNGKGLHVLDHAPSKPVRGIMVSFRDDETVSAGAFWLLNQMRVVERKSESVFKVEQTLPWDKPPDPEAYRAWVYQSVNQTVAARLRGISAEMAVAEAAGAAYMTESAFEAGLCAKLGVRDTSHSKSADAVNFLRANEPHLAIDSAGTVLRLRSENPKLFEQFHATLLETSRQLHGATDFEDRARAILAKEIIPQVGAIEAVASKAMAGGVGGAAVAGSTIGLAMLTGTVLPLAAVLGLGAVLAGGTALPSVAEYLSARRTPTFLWKQIMKY